MKTLVAGRTSDNSLFALMTVDSTLQMSSKSGQQFGPRSIVDISGLPEPTSPERVVVVRDQDNVAHAFVMVQSGNTTRTILHVRIAPGQIFAADLSLPPAPEIRSGSNLLSAALNRIPEPTDNQGIRRVNGLLEVFYQKSDGSIAGRRARNVQNGDFSVDTSLGNPGQPLVDLVAALNPADMLVEVFALTAGGILLSNRQTQPGVWGQQWRRVVTSEPRFIQSFSVLPSRDNVLDVVAIAGVEPSLTVVHARRGDARWTEINQGSLPARFAASSNLTIAVARVSGGTPPLPGPRLTVFAGTNERAADGKTIMRVHTAQQARPDSREWDTWLTLPGSLEVPTARPLSLAVDSSPTTFVDVLAQVDSAVFHSAQGPSGFSEWVKIPAPARQQAI